MQVGITVASLRCCSFPSLIIIAASPTSMVDSRSGGRTSASGRSFRFSRGTSAFALSTNVERPPVVLEWSYPIIRVGLAEQHCPQHLIPWNDDTISSTKIRDEDDWYFVIAPLISKVYDTIMLDPSTRRVVCVTPSLYMPKAWEDAIKQVLWNKNVPAVSFVSCLETVPFSMGWKRGLVVHVGMTEASCLIIADGASLHYTFQAVPCGYNVVAQSDGKVQVEWTERMNTCWLDESNPNSLTTALLKCLSACPRDLKRDVISNIVFAGDAIVIVPDLQRQIRNRLVAILNKTAEPFEEEPISDLTIVPTECKTLAPLVSNVSVTSTAPLRPDVVAWVGASLWTTVWHRHEDKVNIKWEFAPDNSDK